LEGKLRAQDEQMVQIQLDLEKDLEHSKMQVATLKIELEKALKACSEKEQEHLSLQEQLLGSVSEMAGHETARQEAEQSLVKMKQEMDSLKAELLESQIQLADQKKQNEEELVLKETEIENMRNQIVKLESLQTASTAVCEELKEKVNFFTTKFEAAELQREAHNTEVQQLEEELEKAERRKSDDMNLAVEHLETQLKMTMSELEEHKEAAEQSRERVEELESSLTKLNEKLIEKEDTATSLLTIQERNRQLDQKVDALEKQIAEGQQLLSESQQLVKHLKEKDNTLKQEINSLQENEYQLKENMRRLENSENGLKDYVEKLQGSESRWKEFVDELKENENRLKQEVNDLQIKLSKREKVVVDELVPVETSNVFVSVLEQNGEVDQFKHILRDRIRELESLLQESQQQQIEEEARRILSLRKICGNDVV
jgi:chromosome segregation ATPase